MRAEMVVHYVPSHGCASTRMFRHISLSHFGISLFSPGSEKKRLLHLVVRRTRARNVGPLLVLALRISSGYNLASLSPSPSPSRFHPTSLSVLSLLFSFSLALVAAPAFDIEVSSSDARSGNTLENCTLLRISLVVLKFRSAILCRADCS